jgi:hypothetical protein
MGGGGISLHGGDRNTLTPAGHVAENNHIHHYALWDRVYRTAVSLSGVGNQALHLDMRALRWAHCHADQWIKEASEKGILKGIAFKQPPYRDRYPGLARILKNDPKALQGNVVARNICYGGRWDEFKYDAASYVKFEDNLLEGDPRFVDAASRDFELRADSPAWQKGFQRIPFEKIGLKRQYSSTRRISN